MEKEEGEMSDDNAMQVDDAKESMQIDSKRAVLYKAEEKGLVVQELEKLDASKLEERAKRFGLNLIGNRLITQTQIDELYTKSGVESGNERHFRFDAIHLNGIDGLSTREIFEYLEDYKPVSLEHVDDLSCNIVCQDHISVALALLVHSREIRSEELKKMLDEKSSHHWREGMPHPKKDLILMRFATNGDKKLAKTKPVSPKHSVEYDDQSMDPISKNPWGDLCKSWGVYDHQEVFHHHLPKNDYEDEIEEPREVVQIKNKRLALRLGKRSHKTDDSEDSNSDSEWKKRSKTPRMRMHADDEESKLQKKNQLAETASDAERDAYAPLSIEVANSRSHYTPRETTKLSDKFKSKVKTAKSDTNLRKDNIQSRLGARVEQSTEEMWLSEDGSSDNSEHNIMSRVQKVSSAAKSTSSVWARLETTQSKESSQKDLRQILKSRSPKKPDDLRDRISKCKKTNLRIEIDNNYAK